MDIENTTHVEIIDFKRFPQKMKYGAIGMAFGKITHGLTTNYFSETVHEIQLGDDGMPLISISEASNGILYKIASEISIALLFLQGCGWFEDHLQFVAEESSPFGEVAVEGWRTEWNISAQVDLQHYLEDVCQELELDGQIYTQEWYYAKVSHLYFKDGDIPDVAMTIGILLSQMWWKIEQEAAAVRGHDNITSLDSVL